MHGHTHSFTEHKICVATLVYNILILVVELIILAFLSDLHLEDLLAYEGLIQLFHLGGVIVLGLINWWWTHRWADRQTAGRFLSISTVMLVAHVVLLHILPRWIGFEVHHEEHNEQVEYLALIIIVLFVTVAFWRRDMILEKTGLKNKFTVSLKRK